MLRPVKPDGEDGPVTDDAPPPSRGEMTQFLLDLGSGRADPASPLLDPIYDQLKGIAVACVRRGPGPVSGMNATALVNEAYLKLFDHEQLEVKNRGHFFALAARAMRQLLVDHVRHRGRKKRGGDRRREPLDDAVAAVEAQNVDLLDLGDALDTLSELDPVQAQVVELRFFVGATMEEIGELLGFSRATAEREWAAARAWLKVRLDAPPTDRGGDA